MTSHSLFPKKSLGKGCFTARVLPPARSITSNEPLCFLSSSFTFLMPLWQLLSEFQHGVTFPRAQLSPGDAPQLGAGCGRDAGMQERQSGGGEAPQRELRSFPCCRVEVSGIFREQATFVRTEKSTDETTAGAGGGDAGCAGRWRSSRGAVQAQNIPKKPRGIGDQPGPRQSSSAGLG